MKSSFHCEKHIKRTKKDHQCWGCYAVIPEGSSCASIAQAWEGYFVHWYQCDSCSDYLKTEYGKGFWNRHEDGASDGAILEERENPWDDKPVIFDKESIV